MGGWVAEVYDRSARPPQTRRGWPARTIEVVHVGSASRDLTRDDPRGWRLGGGVTYAALTTARLGLRTAALIGVDDDGALGTTSSTCCATRASSSFSSASREAPVFDNQETPDRAGPGVPRGRASRSRSGTSRRRGARRVPGRSSRSRARSTTRWAAAVPPTAYLALGWQGFLRDLAAGERVSATSACRVRAARAGRPRRGESSRRRFRDERRHAHRVPPPGRRPARHRGRPRRRARPRRRGSGRARRSAYLPTATDREIDPTGAGDTFLAALLASVLRPAIVGRHRSRRSPDLRFAAAAGSLAVEGPGLERGPGSGGRARPPHARTRPPGGRPERGLAGRRRRGLAVSGRWPATSRRRVGADPPAQPDRAAPRSASRAGSGRPSRRRRSTASRPRMTASSAPGRSRRRCSRIFASSIAATMAMRPGPAASAVHASAASAWRPSRRSRCARSTAIRSVVHGAARAAPRGARPSRSTDVPGDHRSPPVGVATTTGRRRVAGAATADDGVGTTVRHDRPVRGRLEALERLVEPVLAGERAGETREVARWRLDPLGRVAVAVGEMSEEPGERPDVLVVVAGDLGERLRRPAAQELVIATGDLPALDVADPMQAEELGLRGPQARVGHPVAEQAPDDRQQVEVAGMDRRRPTGQPKPRRQERPVERRGRCRSRARRSAGWPPRSRSAALVPRRGRGASAGPAGSGRRPPTSRGRRGRRPCPRPSRARSSRCRDRRAARPAAVVRGVSRAAPGRPGAAAPASRSGRSVPRASR